MNLKNNKGVIIMKHLWLIFVVCFFIINKSASYASNMIDACIKEGSRSNDTSWNSLVKEDSYYLNKTLACFNNVQKVSPNDPNLYIARSKIYLDLGNVEQAIKDINHPSLFNTSSPDVYTMRIKLYLKLGKEENINIIKSNIDKIFDNYNKNFKYDYNATYFNGFFAGNYNDFIWSL